MLVRATVLALALADAPVPAPIEVPPLPPASLEPGDAPVPEPPSNANAPDQATEPSEAAEPSDARPSKAEPSEAEPVEAEPVEAEPSDATDPAAADDPFGDHADDDPFGDSADDDPWPDEGGDRADAEPLPDYDPLRDSPQAIRARRWVRTGIGTMSAGGALLVGAIIVGASDPCARPAGNSCQVDARNRAALVMGIPAAILIGGGAAMLGLGLTRQRRLAVDLQAGRTSAGIVVRGRF